MKQLDSIRFNDLFFVCSLIEYIARHTHNKHSTVVNAIGRSGLEHLYDLADVYHCENLDKITYDLIGKYDIHQGCYDTITKSQYDIPSFWDLGKVYARLISGLATSRHEDVMTILIEIYNSWMTEKIDDYNSSMFYENNSYLTACYLAGHAI